MDRIAACGLALVFLLLPAASRAETLEGRVIGVADGDTLTVLDAGKKQHRIRLAGIDAPEKRQAFGERSKQNLAGLAFRKDASLDCPKVDRYGRKVCRVMVEGRDVALAQIEAGLAWHYKRFEREQAPEERVEYGRAENEARARRGGLWQDREPAPPWEWRQMPRQH